MAPISSACLQSKERRGSGTFAEVYIDVYGRHFGLVGFSGCLFRCEEVWTWSCPLCLQNRDRNSKKNLASELHSKRPRHAMAHVALKSSRRTTATIRNLEHTSAHLSTPQHTPGAQWQPNQRLENHFCFIVDGIYWIPIDRRLTGSDELGEARTSSNRLGHSILIIDNELTNRTFKWAFYGYPGAQ